jgi:hypothetical protein
MLHLQDQPCPNRSSCQVFTIEGFVESNLVREYYAKTYCDSVEQGWTKCMRFRTKKELNLCPDFVLPDSTITLDEVLDRLENE